MEPISLQLSDEVTALTAGNLLTWRWDVARNIAYVRATLTTPQVSGAKLTVDIKRENGTSIFSTTLTFDNGADNTSFASVASVISNGAFTINEKFTISASIGDGTAKGLRLSFYDYVPDFGTPPPPPPTPVETLVDRTTGTAFGNLNAFGLSYAFDGVTNAAGGQCAAKSASGGYVGKTFTSGKKFSRAIVYGANDKGFVDFGNPSVTISIYGKNGTPSNETDGTVLGTITFTDTANESSGRTINSTNTTTAYTSLWARVVPSSQESTYVAELTLYELV
jgi:hypothetical protein